MSQAKPLVIALILSLASVAVSVSRAQSRQQLVLSPTKQRDATLELIKPYRTWAKMNKQPIALKVDASAFAG